MKKIVLLFFLFSTSISFSQTDVSGTYSSDTTWGTSGSPYTVTGNVLVASGVTLTIEAGVTVKVNSGLYIKNEGVITAVGTSSDKITFESSAGSPAKSDWEGIRIRSTGGSSIDGSQNYSSGSQFKYVVIKHADIGLYIYDAGLHVSYTEFDTNKYGVEIRKTDGVVIDFSTFTGNTAGIWSEYSDYSSGDSVAAISNTYLLNSTFSVNSYGIDLIMNQRDFINLNITKNIFTGNNIGIDFGGGGYGPRVHSVLISENIVYNSTSYGVNLNRVYGQGTGTSLNYPLEFTKNIVLNNAGGSLMFEYSPSVKFKIHKNILVSNTADVNCIASIGSPSTSNHLFDNNTIISKGKNVYFGGSSSYHANNISFTNNLFSNSSNNEIIDVKYGSGHVFNNNNLSNPSSTVYFLKNQTANSIDAENNYWGSATESEIQSAIYDYSDDFELGAVDYTPFSTTLNTTAPISPPSNVTKSISGSDVVLNWSANGESDIAGYKLYYGTPTGYSYVTTVDLGNVTTYTVTGGDIAKEYAITAYDSDKDDDGDDMVDGNESWFSVANQVNVTLSSSATSISEPTNSATLTATLDNTSSADVVVNLTYTGTATNATDYSGAASITISAGSLIGTTTITVIDDTDVELTETIIIDMGDVSGGAENGTQQVTISLTDNDLPSVSSINVDKTDIDENGGVAVITATISAVQSKDVTIPLTYTGTATNATDYSGAASITVFARSLTGTIAITGIKDSNKEDDETIIVTPSTSPTNATGTISDALTVTIVDENFAPVATAQTNVAATEQTEVTITLAGTDSNDDTLTYIIASLPTNGTLSDNGIVVTADDLPKTLSSADVAYVSTSDIATSDSFTFKVNDGTVDSEAATVSLAITAVNDVPVATAQTDVAATEQTAVTLTLAGTDPDGDTLTYIIATLPTNGTLSDVDGSLFISENLPITSTMADVVYVSTSDIATSDSFTFKVNDGTVDSEAATVSLAIKVVNDAPVATAQTDVVATEQTEVTITLAGTDAESDAITYIIATLPTNGTLSDNGTVVTADDLPKTTTSSDVVYVSTSDTATSDSFTFKVNDGTVDSEAATVSIAITEVNDLPTKVNLSSLTIDENASTTEIGTLSTDDLDTNDTFTYELVSGEGDTDNSLFTIDTDKLKNSDAFDFETKSSYSIRVKSTDSGSALIEGVFAITVNNINDITVNSEITSTYCDGSDGTGAITIVTSETNGEVTYLWTGPNGFSSADKNLTGLESGTYNVTVKDDSFEKSIELVVEKTEIFNNLSVCYVTSDSEDFTKNRIFLSYQDIYNDKKYEILREGSSAGIYEKIGELDSGETSFLDTSSNNSSSSYLYRVRMLDNCDVVSSESSIHKTILLQSSLATDNSVNLSWTSYEGVDYSTYKIYRRVNNGTFEELVAISSSLNSYNDTSADITQNSYSYYVSISVESCITTQKTGSKENLSNNFRYTSRVNETTSIKSNQQFVQDDNGDYDNDGVLNAEDQCPSSSEGSTVDVNGCPIFTLPLDNNKVSVISASCIGNTDGSIGLSIEDASYAYSVTVTGKDDPITLGGETKTASVTGLGTGTYTVCFKVDGQDTYEQCFEVSIGEPKALSVFIDVDNDNKTTSIQLSGSSTYNVEVNGERFEVKGDGFTTNLPTGLSIIKISTDLSCQGIIEREVFISEDIHYYPNPTQKDVNVHVSGDDTLVQISVFSEKGDLVYTKQQQIQDFSRKTNIDLSRQITGTYIVVMEGKTVRKTFKIVKR